MGIPVIGKIADSITKLAKMIKSITKILSLVAGGLLVYKQLTPKQAQEQLPKEVPLMNPLVYHTKTPDASAYRALMFDTPEETRHSETYQAHLELRKTLEDLPKSYTNRLPGKRTTLTTTIVAPETLPTIDLLDRDAFTTSFSPDTRLGKTSFTVKQLADSLAFPDVANFVTSESTDGTPNPTPDGGGTTSETPATPQSI